MKPISLLALALVALLVVSNQLTAQTSGRRPQNPVSRNRTIAGIVREIDAKNIERTIRQLVFIRHAQHTVRTKRSKTWSWRRARLALPEFPKAAEAFRWSNDRREAIILNSQKLQRVPQPTVLTNVVATLKGTQPESVDRVYAVLVVTTIRCATVQPDAKCDAPGANDDASGTAAVLEMARVMAKYQFDATIVFMVVPGEEQGLLGATHFAEDAKQRTSTSTRCLRTTSLATRSAAMVLEIEGSVRVFSEGVPSNETPAEANTRRSVGGENDSASRQLARFIKETGDNYAAPMQRHTCLPSRSLRSWW